MELTWGSYSILMDQVLAPPTTRRIGQSGRAHDSRSESLEFETQPHQTNDLQNVYWSLPSMVLRVDRIGIYDWLAQC